MSHLVMALTKHAIGTSIEPNIDNVIAPRLWMNRWPHSEANTVRPRGAKQSKTYKIPSRPHEVNPVRRTDAFPLRDFAGTANETTSSKRGCKIRRDAIEGSNLWAILQIGRTFSVSPAHGSASSDFFKLVP